MTTTSSPRLHEKVEFTPAAPARQRREWIVFSSIALIALCLVLSALRWGKLDRLWGDSSRWLFEAYRMSRGEMPYRDFAWQYPPLALWIWGGSMALFGAKFAVAQVCADVFSGAIVLATWNLARRVVPNTLAVAAAAALACAGASNAGNFALFSLLVYTPAILTAVLGILILSRVLLDWSTERLQPSRHRNLWIAMAGLLCFLSKPESIAGALACFAIAALVRKKQSHNLNGWISIAGLMLVPSLLVYVALLKVTGVRNVLEGIGGYGLASVACPWWPTGLGLFGAALALGHAALAMAVLSLLSFRKSLRRFHARYWAIWVTAVLAVIGDMFYIRFASFDLPVFQNGVNFRGIATYFLSTGTLLLPVMWAALVVGTAALISLVRSRQLTNQHAALLILIAPAAVISLRGLFTGTMSEVPTVAPAAYSIWFVLAASLLFTWFQSTGQNISRAMLMSAALLGGFAILRFASAAATFAHRDRTIETAAGTIQLQDSEASPGVYEFIESHTNASETILDIAAGGIGLAAHRSSPIFSTQFTALMPSARLERRDLERIAGETPRYVIANAGANFGAEYGICMNTACPFPNLVWRSSRLACDPQHETPVLNYVRQHYIARAQFGEKVIYERK